MNKESLNKEWAELEGWTEVLYPEDPDIETYWESPDGEQNEFVCPDFTEPNRFFSEVVPKMRELNFLAMINNTSHLPEHDSWEFNFYSVGRGAKYETSNKSIGEAGLSAAIKARKELGV